jgi:hypothetical protein
MDTRLPKPGHEYAPHPTNSASTTRPRRAELRRYVRGRRGVYVSWLPHSSCILRFTGMFPLSQTCFDEGWLVLEKWEGSQPGWGKKRWACVGEYAMSRVVDIQGQVIVGKEGE